MPASPPAVDTMWHALAANEVIARLAGSEQGLSATEATQRLAQYGFNELPAGHTVSAWRILFEQFQNVLLLILIAATGLSLATGHGTEAIVIAVIVVFAVVLGFIQEYRAERAIEALRQMAAPLASVLRDGRNVQLPARDVVPGDLLLLNAGDKIAADCRLIEVHQLQADEAPLTGESAPVEKQTAPLAGRDLPPGDRVNMAFAGTAVTNGRGRGLVVATGSGTEFGRIATLLHEVEVTRTPLQENLDRVGRMLAAAALAVVLMIVALGWLRGRAAGESWLDLLLFGVALAVAVVPEALPAVVTVSLAIGVQRMLKRNALVRRLPAVETLGSASVICSDKTGTLTKGEMTVQQVAVGASVFDVSGAGYEPVGEFNCDGRPCTPDDDLRELLRAGVLSSDARLVQDEESLRWRIAGDPTEGALLAAAAKAGIAQPDVNREWPRVDEIPFNSDTRRMTTLHRTPDGITAFVKGAPEAVLGLCTQVRSAGRDITFDAVLRQAVTETAQRMAAQALRVLALATQRPATHDSIGGRLTLLGLVGMIDPPRAESQAAIAKCRQAGIHVVMITGDHPLTARTIAERLGICTRGRVVTGPELERLTDAELHDQAEEIEVYARVSPAHKLRIVSALQARGHVVAMTGDGVNDAPALRKADIGIAMGLTGTDVAKEAAEMSLTDDNFASIIAAVEEGRGIYGNIKKYLMYLLSANLGEIGLMAGAALLGLPMPLSAVQILYVNLATDGLPALALAVDPPDDDVMSIPPRNPRHGIFTPPVVRLMVLGGVWSALSNLVLFIGARQLGYAGNEAMTLTFLSLVLIQFFKAYGYRSDHQHVLHRPFTNRWLNAAILWELALLGLILYVPFLSGAFEVTPPTLGEWAFLLFWSHTILPVLELGKWMERRRMWDRLCRAGGRN